MQNCESEFGGHHISDMSINFVRNVAPHKDMMRASFPITFKLLTGEAGNVKQPELEADEPEAKKAKIVE